MGELLPPQTETGSGFESPRVTQFTVFLANRVGKLQALVRQFEEAEARIVALSIEESADATLVRLICSKPEVGREVLGREGFHFHESDVLAVELPRRTKQPLIAISAAILSAEINIHYAYPLLVRPHGPTLVLYVEDPTLASQILIRKGFKLISEGDLREV